MPRRDEAIGRRAAMQVARRIAVHVLGVLVRARTEFHEIEVRVEALQRVVGPLDPRVAARRHTARLFQLQSRAQPGTAQRLVDAGHVRPVQPAGRGDRRAPRTRTPASGRRERRRAAAPRLHQRHHQQHRAHVDVLAPPDAAFHVLHEADVLDGREFPELERE